MSYKIGVNEAIQSLLPGAEFKIVDNDLSTIEFFKPKNAVAPSQEAVDAEIAKLEAKREQDAADLLARKESAKAKLEALGLDAAEVSALLG